MARIGRGAAAAALRGRGAGWRAFIYALSQALLAPGGAARVARRLAHALAGIAPSASVLDIGCGPFSLLWRQGLRPIGLDRSEFHLRAYRGAGAPVCAATATALPFAAERFDVVVALGLLHHLGDEAARAALGEMRRVARPGGTILVFDAVLPEPAWRRPLAALIRRADRGRHMRREHELASLLAAIGAWSQERFTYAATGLEGVLCVQRK